MNNNITEPLERDSLIPDVIKFIEGKVAVSTGMIMKKFMIGFNRSPKILQQLVELGYITPSSDSNIYYVNNKED